LSDSLHKYKIFDENAMQKCNVFADYFILEKTK